MAAAARKNPLPKSLVLTKVSKDSGKTAEIYRIHKSGAHEFEVILDGESGGIVTAPHMIVVRGVKPNPYVIGWKDKFFQLTTEEYKAINAYQTPDEIEKSAEFERNVPGLKELDMAYLRMNADQERHDDAMEHLMDEDNDGAYFPAPMDDALRQAYRELAAKYPRAELYRRARSQSNSAHWSDNAGKGAAGDRAMQVLRSGGSIEDAMAALAVRRTPVD